MLASFNIPGARPRLARWYQRGVCQNQAALRSGGGVLLLSYPVHQHRPAVDVVFRVSAVPGRPAGRGALGRVDHRVRAHIRVAAGHAGGRALLRPARLPRRRVPGVGVREHRVSAVFAEHGQFPRAVRRIGVHGAWLRARRHDRLDHAYQPLVPRERGHRRRRGGRGLGRGGRHHPELGRGAYRCVRAVLSVRVRGGAGAGAGRHNVRTSAKRPA